MANALKPQKRASGLSPEEVLNRYFPEVRAWLIQIAAVLDRYERAGGGEDERLELYRKAVDVLRETDDTEDRAERIQMIFSDKYTGTHL